MPVLWGLQMAAGKKITLSGIFGLGIMYVQFPSLNRYLTSFLLIKIQHLYHYPDPHYHHRMESRYERPAGILPACPLHLPRSPPRRHQRLPSRPEAHLQQAWRLQRVRLDLVRHVRNDPHLHAPKPNGLELDESLGKEERLGDGE